MHNPRWDAIILGAGVAGCALARRLAPVHRVLMLEQRSRLAKAPRIGESLPGAARVLLQELGLLERFLSGPHRERGPAVSTWDSDTPVWQDAITAPSGPGWVLDRQAFDDLLRDGAVEAGAELRTGCRRMDITTDASGWRVHLPFEGVTHHAPIVVDATGRSGGIAHRLGLTRVADDPLVCLYSILPARPDDHDASLRTCADDHGWWYSVKLPSEKRVLAYHLDINDPLRRELNVPEAFQQRARRQPLLSQVLGERELAPVHNHPAGTALLEIDNLASADKGFLAIGDALMTFDPISSQGLFHALATAASAHKAICNGFPENNDALRAFQTEMQAVQRRYLDHWQRTYAGPRRFSQCPFWATRAQGDVQTV
ncbi:NAD(P)/FAD-dependent oxidoreductase [Saccharospirillum salsuginis]|uniref:FAD-binding domain-containing protein n=1 Tax=Saccharospirillum salsuginis TaxID=418750 RepID=A0A918NK02_9GAMM|nr:NAD(P)/FAD-dependent oxidoreductase [Saccharospirillum salsuginis]GGX73746.1 hypothetical protein GCM10007392_46540 [Saccharospirillum salsuginis]